MTIPVILFCCLVGAAYGCIAHLIRGGNLFIWLVFMALGIIGFFLGNYFGSAVGDGSLQFGMIHFTWGSIGSFIILLVFYFISKPMF